MSSSTKTILKSIFVLAIMALGFQAAMAVWQSPSSNPPGGNVPPPINTGSVAQNKDGSLGVGGLNVYSASTFGGSASFGGLVVLNNGLKIPSGAGSGKVLTSDADGDVSWQTPAGGGAGDNYWVKQGNNISYTDGKVGIKNTNPLVELSVTGQTFSSKGFRVADEGNNSRVNDAPWYGVGMSDFGNFLRDGGKAVQVAGYYGLLFKTDKGEVFVDRDGKVGIKEVDPQHELDVNGDINTQGSLCIKNDCRGAWPGGPGGSQTPWTSDINAAGNRLHSEGVGYNNLILSGAKNSSNGFVSINPEGGLTVVGLSVEDNRIEHILNNNKFKTGLAVGGIIASTNQGFMFPDKTIQNTASIHGRVRFDPGLPTGLNAHTFVVPAGITKVWVTMSAGGGAGGCTQGADVVAGGGGGGGAILYKEVSVNPGESIDVVAGGGGSKCSGLNFNGGNGGDSKFGSYSVGGGKGGERYTGSGWGGGGAAGGPGGARGRRGGKSDQFSKSPDAPFETPYGGNSIFGVVDEGWGADGVGYGAGGNGGSTIGGKGAPGFVLIEW